jgi:two-component system chemotaxis response regulator CheV
VTRVDGELVEIIDVEEVLVRLIGPQGEAAEDTPALGGGNARRVLVADDSSVARAQIRRTLDKLGVTCDIAKNGREAWEMLDAIAREAGGSPVGERIGMVISDVEMPEMDGYTLTKHIKEDPRLQGLYVLLHTSLSGVFNTSMVQKVGADEFLPKFDGDELARSVRRQLSPGGD